MLLLPVRVWMRPWEENRRNSDGMVVVVVVVVVGSHHAVLAGLWVRSVAVHSPIGPSDRLDTQTHRDHASQGRKRKERER